MIKLTKAQQSVMDHAKSEIDYARTHSFLYWIAKNFTQMPLEKDWDSHPNPNLSNKYAMDKATKAVEDDKLPVVAYGVEIFPENHRRIAYENEKKGITTTITSSNTLRALERLGLIKIIHDGRNGVDTIQVIGY